MASLGSAPSLLVGTAVGGAATIALAPEFEVPKQTAWAGKPNRILDTGLLARLVAEGGVALGNADGSTPGSAYDEARRDGFSSDKLDALIYLSQTVPAFAEAVNAYRRGNLSESLLRHVLGKNAVDTRYHDAVVELVNERLDPAVIALAVVRGIMDDPGFLPVGPPTTEGKVKAFPVSPLDTLKEAAAAGWDKERLFVQTAISGRPMGPELAARASFRDLIEKVDYSRAIAEGDVRNEWAEAIYEVSREIPTSHNYIDARLRGWITDNEMYAGTAKHGMSKDDTDLIHKDLGRPLSFHQVFIGGRRGGEYDGPTDAIDPAFLKSLQESDIRPEWYNLAWAQRNNLPTAFVLRSLTEAKDITEAQAKQILLWEGWPEDLATSVAAKWAQTTTKTAAGPYVQKADTQLWTATHKAYVKNGLAQTQVTPALDMLAISAADQQTIFARWDMEKTVDADVAPAA